MEQPQAFENKALESLNASRTVRNFLNTTEKLLAEAINMQFKKVFRKDDYAVRYAVEPLLLGNGPLGELSVRLKLIYGLGIISRHEYEDCEQLMALREEIKNERQEHRFTDDSIIRSFAALHCVKSLPPPPKITGEDAQLQVMHQQRYQQIVRSSMVLSLAELITHIGTKKTFQK